MQNVQQNKLAVVHNYFSKQTNSSVDECRPLIHKILKNITINRNVKMATTDPEGSDDDDDNRGITSILTVDDMLITGLSLGGYTKQRIERAKGSTNIDRNKSLYGSSPRVCAMIWKTFKQQVFLMLMFCQETARSSGF